MRRLSRMPRDSTTLRRVVRGSSSMAWRLGEGETSGSRWTPGAGVRHADGIRRWRDGGRWAAPDADAEARRRRHNVLGPASRRLGWGSAERRWSSRTDGLGWTRAPVHEGARKALRGGPAPEEAGQRWRGGGLSSGRRPATKVTRRRGGVEAEVHGQRRRAQTASVAASDSARSDRGAWTADSAVGADFFSRTHGDGRAPPHSANEGVTGGDTEADRQVPPTTISPI
jgi:hypothetical protein